MLVSELSMFADCKDQGANLYHDSPIIGLLLKYYESFPGFLSRIMWFPNVVLSQGGGGTC
jgi:hypothetical protein